MQVRDSTPFELLTSVGPLSRKLVRRSDPYFSSEASLSTCRAGLAVLMTLVSQQLAFVRRSRP